MNSKTQYQLRSAPLLRQLKTWPVTVWQASWGCVTYNLGDYIILSVGGWIKGIVDADL